jgi:hypothetical protein
MNPGLIDSFGSQNHRSHPENTLKRENEVIIVVIIIAYFPLIFRGELVVFKCTLLEVKNEEAT